MMDRRQWPDAKQSMQQLRSEWVRVYVQGVSQGLFFLLTSHLYRIPDGLGR